jgi:hypothetical protein
LAPVFSRRLAEAAAFSGGPTSQYLVPPGLVAVVKMISIVWGDVTISGLDVWVLDSSLAKLVRRTISAGTEPYELGGGCDVFLGWWVYTPGESLSFQTATGTCDIIVSGYELTLP